ncbi:MAG: hypothetical protein AAFY42_00440 [Pseudomonadota bacterium]
MIKNRILELSALAMGAAAAVALTDDGPTWQLTYAHDREGNAVEGSKSALIEAVREGRPVRVYWAGGRVEHVTDSYFLTVFQGEIFAQTPLITGQRPRTDPVRIEFPEDGSTWNTIHATNGDRALRWFVRSNQPMPA